MEVLPRDVTSGIGTKQRDRALQIIGLANTVHRILGGKALHELRMRLSRRMRIGTGTHGVHANAMRRQEAGEVLGELNYSRFRGPVTRRIRKLLSIVHPIVRSKMTVE